MSASPEVASAMTIGVVAQRTGLEISAIRYYESIGLIPAPRRIGGKRRYDRDVFESIALLRLAQDAGFTLAETRALISGFDGSTPASARWQTMARKKLVDVTARIERAEQMRDVLEKLLRCKCQTLAQCVRARAEALSTLASAKPNDRRIGA